MPDANEITTVSAMTISASGIEREMAPIDIAGSTWVEEMVEPVEAEAAHREDQRAPRPLERQNEDAQHRAVQEADIQRENAASR